MSGDVQISVVDRAAIRRRRLWLYAFAALGLAAVISFAVVEISHNSNDADKTTATKITQVLPLVLERFKLTAAPGQRGRGIAELNSRAGANYLRVLIADLKPSAENEVYQISLSRAGGQSKLLGNEVVGSNKTFLGEAKISSDELHQYSRIELRRVQQGGSAVSTLVVRGPIPK